MRKLSYEKPRTTVLQMLMPREALLQSLSGRTESPDGDRGLGKHIGFGGTVSGEDAPAPEARDIDWDNWEDE